MSVARWLETDSLSNQNIASAAAIGAYTADADRMVVVDVSLDQVAGNGDYVIYVTRRINGAGSAYVMLPKTTCAAASGETAIAMQSGMISVRSGDVLTVYVDGLAGDTATPDTVVRFFEVATLQPTDAGRTLDILATGEASANVTYSAGVAVSGRLAEVTDLPSEPLDATATQAAAAAALTAYDPPTAAELISVVAAGAAGDPWTTVLPGSYTSDQAGGIVGGLAAIDTTAVTYVTRNNAGDLTITRALTFDETITGLTIPATWVEAIWTLKRSVRQEDSEALLQLKATNPAALTDGLQRLNGASPVAPLSAASGTLTISQAAGTARVFLSDDATAELTEHSTAGYDLKFIDAAGNSTGVRGEAVIDLTETREVRGKYELHLLRRP